ACGRLMMGSNHLPAALLCGKKQMHEVRVGNAEQRLDPLGLEEIEDSFVDFYGHARVCPGFFIGLHLLRCTAMLITYGALVKSACGRWICARSTGPSTAGGVSRRTLWDLPAHPRFDRHVPLRAGLRATPHC